MRGKRLSDLLSGIKQGGKVYPEEVAFGVTPQIGDVWYVDGVNGNDTSNTGRDIHNPLASMQAGARAQVTNRQNDIVVIIPGGESNGGRISEDVAVTWDKDYTHIVGAAAPVGISPRARILNGTALTSAFFTLSGKGCTLENLQVATFVDTNACFSVSEDRNYFNGVHFAGMGIAAAGDDTSGRSLELNGAEECLFESCVIGLDTIARSTTNAEIELKSSATRNRFHGCDILAFADNAGHLFVKADAAAASIDRFAKFHGCTFINPIDSTATAMTSAIAAHASLGGFILLKDCSLVGASDWDASDTGKVMIDGASPTANASGLFVDTTA